MVAIFVIFHPRGGVRLSRLLLEVCMGNVVRALQQVPKGLMRVVPWGGIVWLSELVQPRAVVGDLRPIGV